MANAMTFDFKVEGSDAAQKQLDLLGQTMKTMQAQMDYVSQKFKLFGGTIGVTTSKLLLLNSQAKEQKKVLDILSAEQGKQIQALNSAREALSELTKGKKQYTDLTEDEKKAVDDAKDKVLEHQLAVSKLQEEYLHARTNMDGFADAAKGSLKEAFDQSSVNALGQKLAGGFRVALSGMQSALTGFGAAMAKSLPATIGAATKAAVSLVSYAKDKFVDYAKNIYSAAMSTEMGEAFKEQFEEVKGSAQGVLNEAFAPMFQGLSGLLTAFGPQLTTALSGIFQGGDGNLLADGLTRLFTEGIVLLSQQLPTILEGLNTVVVAVLTALGQSLPALIGALLPVLMESFAFLIASVVDLLPDLLPVLLEAGMQLFLQLINGLNMVVPILIGQLPEIIGQVSQVIIENLPLLINAGVELLLNLMEGVTVALPELMEQFMAMVPTLANLISENLPKIIETGIELLTSLITGITDAVPELIDKVVELIPTIVNTLLDNLPKLVQAGLELLVAIAVGLVQAIPDLIREIPTIAGKIIDAFKEVDWWGLGKELLLGIGKGIVEAGGALWDMVKAACAGILKKIKGFFGIHSPSRVFRDQVGINLAKGLGLGFLGEMDKVGEQMKEAIPTRFGGIAIGGGPNAAFVAASAGAPGGVVLNQTVNNYSPKALSPAETARLNRNAMRQMMMGVKFA